MESFWDGVNWEQVLSVGWQIMLLFGIPVIAWIIRTFVQPKIHKDTWERIVSAATVIFDIVEAMGIEGDSGAKLREGLRLVRAEMGKLSPGQEEIVAGIFAAKAKAEKKSR